MQSHHFSEPMADPFRSLLVRIKHILVILQQLSCMVLAIISKSKRTLVLCMMHVAAICAAVVPGLHSS